jgi:cellulose synthase/poly-beta-1,6-N-acetylglucosamine synthase-like glycosyltransferase
MMNGSASRCMGKPLVSVIIPAYKTVPFITETLESVFAQTFKNFEVIVINDGSPATEEFEQVLRPYMSRVAYIKQENRVPVQLGISSFCRRSVNTSPSWMLIICCYWNT